MKKQYKRRKSSKPTQLRKVFFLISALIICAFFFHYRHGITYWWKVAKQKFNSEQTDSTIKLTKYDIRNIELMDRYYLDTFGLDVSQYQGEIDWTQMSTIYDIYPIQYVFIRATMGSLNTDNRFQENWYASKQNGFLRGAYHFYRPDENSTSQARNFIQNVKLESGDLPPVLDIETTPKTQSMDKLIEGLKNWCEIIEAHYGVKPIIYTSDKYHQDFLLQHFESYIIWIANYNFFVEKMQSHWDFWQFTEKAQIKGTREKVDVNIYKGNIDGLKNLTL